MNEHRHVNRINIGTASIVLILIILCLSIFSLLSLSDASASLSFARRRAESVTAFYEADRQVQTWLSAVESMDPSEASQCREGLSERASVSLSEETGILTVTVPMAQGQALTARYQAADGFLLSSQVTNSEDYAIDTSLPVWTGQEPTS